MHHSLVRTRLSCFAILFVVLALLVIGVNSPASAADSDGQHAEHQESYLVWIARCSGVIGAVILLLSIYFLATVIRLFMEIREPIAAPPGLLLDFETYLKNRDFRQLYHDLKQSGSFLGTVLAAGMSELSNGLPEAREALDRASDAETVGMEKSISMLAVLGTLGPMIGLLGTLKGMISSFSVIAMSDVQVKANQVAGGISEALLLTFEGVMLSVPAIYFFALFRNRVAAISANTTLLADQLLRRLSQAAQWKPAPPSPATEKK
jgi:biopolymer transport protein ExbB